MLHVTNGSVAMSRLHDLGVPGRIIPWDDILHEGPVPANLSGDELRWERARFLSSKDDEVDAIERSLHARDEALDEAASGDEVVLWFEHDLYDQLQVLQILDRLSAQGRPPVARVTAILADDYLAAQTDARLQQWFDARRVVSAAQWDAARAAWAAFRAPDPLALDAFGHEGAWPSLTAALRRHLQQFPWVQNGLSRTEKQTLSAVAGGALMVRAAFIASNHDVEAAIFMGDLGWWFHVRPLLTGPQPLLAVIGDHPDSFHDPDWWRDDDQAPSLTLTETGAEVLAGAADHVALNGINRWLGGVHLMALPGATGSGATALWRWDDAAGRIVHA